MKAKIKPRINLYNRTRLECVIPLSTPMTIFLDPCNICTFQCRFCPTGYPDIIKNTGRYQGQMNFDLYKKIINDLDEFDKPINILRLYKEGEPLVNKNFVDMVQYAKYNGNVNMVDTTTNGYLLNPTLNREILDAGLDAIFISINGMSGEQLSQFSNIKMDSKGFDRYVENIKNFYEIRENGGYKCDIRIKIAGDFLNEDDKKRFFDMFGDFCDTINIERVSPCWPNFDVEKNAGIEISKTSGIYNQQIDTEKNIKVCPYIFYMTTINTDGTVSLCFVDWEHKMIIGDVGKQSLKDIWEGEKLFIYQLENLRGNRTDTTACRNCGQLIYGLPDNIDQYANILTEKLLMLRNY